MRLLKYLIIVQAVYILLTALWPIIDIRSFMAVTGYKTDIWLVKTVGALLIPVALTLVMYLYIPTDRRPALMLGSGTAAAFICIDFYYALTDVIPDIYLADGLAEILFLACWLYIALKHPQLLKK